MQKGTKQSITDALSILIQATESGESGVESTDFVQAALAIDKTVKLYCHRIDQIFNAIQKLLCSNTKCKNSKENSTRSGAKLNNEKLFLSLPQIVLAKPSTLELCMLPTSSSDNIHNAIISKPTPLFLLPPQHQPVLPQDPYRHLRVVSSYLDTSYALLIDEGDKKIFDRVLREHKDLTHPAIAPESIASMPSARRLSAVAEEFENQAVYDNNPDMMMSENISPPHLAITTNTANNPAEKKPIPTRRGRFLNPDEHLGGDRLLKVNHSIRKTTHSNSFKEKGAVCELLMLNSDFYVDEILKGSCFWDTTNEKTKSASEDLKDLTNRIMPGSILEKNTIDDLTYFKGESLLGNYCFDGSLKPKVIPNKLSIYPCFRRPPLLMSSVFFPMQYASIENLLVSAKQSLSSKSERVTSKNKGTRLGSSVPTCTDDPEDPNDADENSFFVFDGEEKSLERAVEEAQESYGNVLSHHLEVLKAKDEQELRMSARDEDFHLRIEKWNEFLEKHLETVQSQPRFNIRKYQSNVIASIAKKEDSAATFEDVVKGLPRYDVCRTFVTALSLTNMHQVDLLTPDGVCVDSLSSACNGNFRIRLNPRPRYSMLFSMSNPYYVIYNNLEV